MSPSAWVVSAPREALALVALAFLGSWALTEALTRWLAARNLGKAIRVDGPAHGAKAGTPTMGGLAMIVVIVSCAVWLTHRHHDPSPLFVAVAIVAYGALGLWDDVAGLARRSGARELGVGLTARRMFAAQSLVGIGLGAVWASRSPADFGSVALGTAIVAVTAAATVNATNMADGLDGLAAGVCALAFAAHAVIVGLDPVLPAWLPAVGPEGRQALLALSLTASAACAGFLLVNRHPARVFMGNVGSMALGAGLAFIALASGTWLLLPVVAAVLVAEVGSVLLQVGYFKATGGRRILRMAPLHHHFEAGGLAEVRVVRGFWLAAGIAAAIGVALAAGLAR